MPEEGRAGSPGALLETGRDRYRRREWEVARDHLRRAQSEADLGGEDLYALANCSWWLGELDVAIPDLQQAYRRYVEVGDPLAASMVALDIGYTSGLRGDQAQASGWIGRALRHVDDAVGADGDCAERGYLDYTRYEHALGSGDLDDAHDLAREIEATGRRFEDRTLVALGTLGQGRVAIAAGDLHRGLARIDEAMVAAVSDGLDPGWAGNIYCNMMMVCHELADWPRANEWTAVTERWCESMPGAGPFLGICRVHRAQVLHARGDWAAAEVQARRVCADMVDFVPAMVGEAWYAIGDLQRQRGRLAEAESSYRDAHRYGRDPWPGLALLRLAQGRRSAAAIDIARALDAVAGSRLARARMLPAAVEILIAVDDVDAAVAAAAELVEVAATYPTTGFVAAAEAALGAVALARGHHTVALEHLDRAISTCRRQCTPYEEARLRLMAADAHRAIGNTDAAALEAAAGRDELERLGAAVEADGRSARAHRPDGLSQREAEILELLGDGLSNKEIASELVLSVRTVERHLATVYRKLDLHGRSARTAAVRYVLGQGDGRSIT